MNQHAPNTALDRPIAALLRAVIDAVEGALPGRIRAYYLLGSYADGGGGSTSDLDLCLVAKGALSRHEQAQLQALQHSCSLTAPFGLDIAVLDESLLLTTGHFKVKYASRFLWGDDVRTSLPDMTLAAYRHYYRVAPTAYFVQVLRRREQSTFPLSYPDPAGEFYGYDQHYLPPTSIARHNIKGLVSAAC